MPQTTDRFTGASDARFAYTSAGKAILDSMGIELTTVSQFDQSTFANDVKSRYVSSEDKGNFQESQTNKSLLGKRGGAIIGKLTTPSASFPAIPTVAFREALRTTKRNLDRFRSDEVRSIESSIQNEVANYGTARDQAVTRLRSLHPNLFRSYEDIYNEQAEAAKLQKLRRGFASSRAEQIRYSNNIVRNSLIDDDAKRIEGDIDKRINAFHRDAIEGRQLERARLLETRDVAAAAGTTGTTPLTVRFGRGAAQVEAATGEGPISQGITPEILDAQNRETGTVGNRAQATPTGGTELSRKVNETRLSTARQRLKRVRDSSSDT